MTQSHDKILIVDFGSQVTQLIARRVREEGVYSEVVPFQKAEAAFREMRPKAVILSGGPESVTDRRLAARPARPLRRRRAGLRHLLRPAGDGGAARRRGRGRAPCGVRPRRDRDPAPTARSSSGVWHVGEKYPVWMSHGDRVTKLPDGFETLAVSRERALRGRRGRGPPVLRRAVPPGGRAYAARRAAHPQLRARHRRLPRRLDHGGLPGGGDRAHPRAGRQAAG